VASYRNKEWTKAELLKRVGDMQQIAPVRTAQLKGGRSEGVDAIFLENGSGLAMTVLPGRCLDLAGLSYKGFPFAFISGTGITSAAYYEEPGEGWVRSFYGGLLETCGITYSGADCIDQGKALGIHGRIGNCAAEDLSIRKRWDEDEYRIGIEGIMREVSAFRGLNISLHRKIETSLGQKGFTLTDVVRNNDFDEQPIMMLYHFNFGFPALNEQTRVVAPIVSTEARDEAARSGQGVEKCLTGEPPQDSFPSKVFFHEQGCEKNGDTFVAVVNPDNGDGQALALVIRYNKHQLPELTECKIMKNGFYFLALEPGLAVPLGREVLREQGRLKILQGQEEYRIDIRIEILDDNADIQALEQEATGGK
jgi:hypothetical protein